MSDKEITQIDSLKEPMAMAEIFSQSGMFLDIKSQAQAVVKILAGRELGLTAFESMASIYIVGGKLALTSKAMSSLVKKSAKYDYKVDKLDNEECTISFINKSDGTVIGVSTFTLKDAAKAGLVNKDVWKNYPKNLLFARALSNGARFFCPDAIAGYYATEELEDISHPIADINKSEVIIDVDGTIGKT
jgi:hypothetical protein